MEISGIVTSWRIHTFSLTFDSSSPEGSSAVFAVTQTGGSNTQTSSRAIVRPPLPDEKKKLKDISESLLLARFVHVKKGNLTPVVLWSSQVKHFC